MHNINIFLENKETNKNLWRQTGQRKMDNAKKYILHEEKQSRSKI